MKNEQTPLGLTTEEAIRRGQQFGKNELTQEKKDNPVVKILKMVCEPMFLLLIAAAAIYFFLGEPRDGIIMLIFVLAAIAVDVIQELKTDRTINALRELSAPHVTVLRDGREQQIVSRDLVPGDVMLICEGGKIPADGVIIRCSDLTVDESTLTGEAVGVMKTCTDTELPRNSHWQLDCVYAGTLVTQGSATVRVEAIGAQTEYGKIGKNIAEAPDFPTPLQKQTNRLVRFCALLAAGLFLLVGIVTFFNLPGEAPGERIIRSFLSGITLAMAMIPEEFPVIMTVFLSLGAWRLARKKSLVRRLPSVETLGAVSVLCVDKTGTITENRMKVEQVWSPADNTEELCETMGLGCESNTYDPMEQAMLKYCADAGYDTGHLFGGELLHEYTFSNELKMMGHVWLHDGECLIAAKGSPERLLPLCSLSTAPKAEAEGKLRELSAHGLRVIAVARMSVADPSKLPERLTDCNFSLCGLIGLSDPPRAGIRDDIETCRRAGVRVVMITGDNGTTAAAIAGRVGIDAGTVITGDELERLDDEQLRVTVRNCNVFSRVIPEHKMRIVRALRDNGEIVAMTGDGVNDAPALKYADIGIAMGGRGSEVSREAADLILMDDNFSTIVDTIRDGRRIYDNIRRAIGYVFSIHIPIALSSLLAPMIGIRPDSLLMLPILVVLLELVIDPTCAVVLERQPAERNIMNRSPRDPGEKLVNRRLLGKSVLQGLAIFAAFFGSYYFLLLTTGDALLARSMGLAVILFSNIFLVQVNSSGEDFLFTTVRRLARDPVMWGANLFSLALLAIVLYSPANAYLKLSALSPALLAAALGIAAAAVLWYELVKLVKRHHR